MALIIIYFVSFILKNEILCVSHEFNHNTYPDIYRPKRSWGKVIFSHASVILSTGGRVCSRGCLLPGWSLLWGCLVLGDVCSRGLSGPGGCLVLGGYLVPGGCPVETPSGWLLLRAVRILLECILVSVFALNFVL